MTTTQVDLDLLTKRAEALNPWRYDHKVGNKVVIRGTPESAPIHGEFGRGAEIMQHIVQRLAQLGNVSDKRALDLGCLEGHYTDILCASGFKEVVAVDLSAEHIARARFLLTELRGYRNVTFIEGNIEDETIRTQLGRFDVILFHGLLYHLTDPVATTRALASLGTPGHALLVSTQFKFDFADIVSEAPLANIKFRTLSQSPDGKVFDATVGSSYAPYAVRLNPRAIHRMLTQCGYGEIIGYDTPLGARYGYQLHLVARAGTETGLQSALSAEPLIPGLNFYPYDGTRIDGVDFRRQLVPRLSRFISKVGYFVSARLASSGALQSARQRIPQDWHR